MFDLNPKNQAHNPPPPQVLSNGEIESGALDTCPSMCSPASPPINLSHENYAVNKWKVILLWYLSFRFLWSQPGCGAPAAGRILGDPAVHIKSVLDNLATDVLKSWLLVLKAPRIKRGVRFTDQEFRP